MNFRQFILEKSKEETQDELENLATILRQMARTQGFINFHVSIEEDHILIEVIMNNEETFQKLFRLIEFIRKIKKDYLPGFKCDMDLWETKKGKPIFTFEFYYASTSSSAPIYPYDNDDFPF